MSDRFAQDHLDYLLSVGMDPADDERERDLLATEVRDRQLEHGSLLRAPVPPTCGRPRSFTADERAVQAALHPHTGNVTPLGVHKDAA